MKLKRKEEELEDIEETEEDRIDEDKLDDDLLNDDLYNDDFYGEVNNPPIKKHADLLKELTNFSPYLKKIFNNWLGLIWDDKQQNYVRNPFIKPIMNLKGAAWCINFLETYARSNNIITHINQLDYNYLVEDMIDMIYLNIGTRNDFGIKKTGDIILIGGQLLHSAQLTLMGAGDGKYNKFLGTTYSSHSTSNPEGAKNLGYNKDIMPMKQDQGFLNNFRKMLIGK